MAFKVGSYVLVRNFGLGILSSFSGDKFVNVNFGKSERCFLYEPNGNDYLSEVPDRFVKLINDEMANKYHFAQTTISRSRGYDNLDKINNFVCKDNYISADVKGNNTYKTKITFVNDRVVPSCSCPVGINCKHSYALLNLLNRQIVIAGTAQKTKVEKSVVFNNLMEKDNVDYEWIKELNNCISSIELNNVFSYLTAKDELNIKEYLLILILKRKMRLEREDFDTQINKLLVKFPELTIYVNPKYSNYFYEMITHVIEYDFDDFLIALKDYIKDSKDTLILKHLSSFIYYAIDLELGKSWHYGDKITPFLLIVTEYDDSYFHYVCSTSKGIYFCGESICKHNSLLKKLTSEEFLKILGDNSVNDNPKLLKEFSLRAPSIAKENLNEYINFLVFNFYVDSDYNLDHLVDLIPHNNLVRILMRLYKDKVNFEVLEKEDFSYFSLKISGQLINSWYNESDDYMIYLDIILGKEKIHIVQKTELHDDLKRSYSFNDEHVSKMSEQDLDYLFQRIKELDINGLGTILKSLEKERDKAYLNKKREKLLNSFASFRNYYSSNIASTYQDNYKYDFLPYFTKNSHSFFDMKVKLGSKKYYVIKNIQSLVSKFYSNGSIELGKNEIFHCNIDNLTERGQKFLKILGGLVNPEIYNSLSSLSVSQSAFLEILQLYKGEYISIDKKELFVSLEEISFDTKLNQEYQIEITPKFDMCYQILDKLLIIHDSRIDYCYVKDTSLEFLRFFLKMDKDDIKLVKDEFINQIYPLVADKIQVDEKIKDEFKLSVLEIDSYFDYEDKVIKVDTKYRIGENEVKVDSIIDGANYNKLMQYRRTLENLGFDLQTKKIMDDEYIYSFFKLDFSTLKKITNVFLSDSILNKKISQFVSPKFKLVYDNNLMDCFFEKSEYSEEELYQILSSIRNKKKYVMLKGDRIIDLDSEESKVFSQIVKDLDLDPKHLYTEEHEPLYKSLKISNYLDKGEVDGYILKMIDSLANFKNANYQVPQVNGELRKYQVEGYKWLKVLENYNLGGILADDMGLGKSLEIICLLKSSSIQKPSLIVCPKSLIFNWVNEFYKFDPNAKVVKIYGNSFERGMIISQIDPNKKVTYITSYDSLRNDIDKYQMEFEFLIIDEAQYIKNIEALKTRKVKQLNANHKLALTGTPIENNLLDLWSIFDFIMPKYLDGITSFKEKCQDEEYINLVSKKVSPFILRRTKKEVLTDLPNKVERIVTSEMTKEQRKNYDAICLKAKEELEESGKAFNVLYLLTRLRQICVSPSLFVKDYHETSGKIATLLELIQDYISQGHRILLFSQFVKALELIEDPLKKLKIKYYKLTGDTPAEKRIKDMNSFNSNEEIKVYLISLKAGGTGLNLIGADTIIHLDPWWNVSSENQASDRAYRIGQTRNVEVIKLICENSIEERVIELQQIKKDLIDKVISNDDSSITGLSKEDIEFLLK